MFSHPQVASLASINIFVIFSSFINNLQLNKHSFYGGLFISDKDEDVTRTVERHLHRQSSDDTAGGGDTVVCAVSRQAAVVCLGINSPAAHQNGEMGKASKMVYSVFILIYPPRAVMLHSEAPCAYLMLFMHGCARG